MEKPRFASFVDLFLEIQIRIDPCPEISCLRNRSNVDASYGKAVNIYFGKLLFCTNQDELSFDPHTNVRYTAFHGIDLISMISSQVRTRRQVKLSVISIGMCLR